MAGSVSTTHPRVMLNGVKHLGSADVRFLSAEILRLRLQNDTMGATRTPITL
jgi:hypothetical protein